MHLCASNSCSISLGEMRKVVVVLGIIALMALAVPMVNSLQFKLPVGPLKSLFRIAHIEAQIPESFCVGKECKPTRAEYEPPTLVQIAVSRAIIISSYVAMNIYAYATTPNKEIFMSFMSGSLLVIANAFLPWFLQFSTLWGVISAMIVNTSMLVFLWKLDVGIMRYLNGLTRWWAPANPRLAQITLSIAYGMIPLIFGWYGPSEFSKYTGFYLFNPTAFNTPLCLTKYLPSLCCCTFF